MFVVVYISGTSSWVPGQTSATGPFTDRLEAIQFLVRNGFRPFPPEYKNHKQKHLYYKGKADTFAKVCKIGSLRSP